MSQTISNDYVSMINKKGSGYNIPVIVDAIVDASIIPVKNIVLARNCFRNFCHCHIFAFVNETFAYRIQVPGTYSK
jgi:hypothetical protein